MQFQQTNFASGEQALDQALDQARYQAQDVPSYTNFGGSKSGGRTTAHLFQEPTLTPEEMKAKEFNLQFNSAFNEQFHRDFKRQSEALTQHKKFRRTRQSIEVERMNTVGDKDDGRPYQLYEENSLKPTTIRKQAFGHQNVECNLLNQVYMSPENIENVQQTIRYNVWIQSNKQHVIGKQSEIDLQIIMRSIYLQYGKNLPYNIKEQIRDLNDLVVQEATSKILSQIQQHLYYLFDASTQPMPLQTPISTNSKGLKQLNSVTNIFFN